MGRNVFANGLEVSGKASANRSIAAMPDVCLSPPGPPAGPIPIPYPNTAFAKDTARGSRSVKIGGQEVGKKNSSTYSKSTGNEAATRSFGMNVVSHNITGPMKFAAWSMDVMVEGANATRFMDLTTHNHGNPSGGAASSSMAGMEPPDFGTDCDHLAGKNADARKNNAKLDDSVTVTHGVFRDSGGYKEFVRGSSKGNMGNGWAVGVSTKERRLSLTPAQREYLDFQTSTPQSQLDKKADAQAQGKDYDPKDRDKHGTLACFGSGREKTPFAYSSYESMTPNYPAHAEPKIIDEIFLTQANPNGGSLLLAIDWPGGGEAGQTKESPCKQSCAKLICAIEEAGCLDIWLCERNDEGKLEMKKPTCPPATACS